MSLTINDIFPCADENDRILEPKQCTKYPTFPGIYSESEARVVYRRRMGKGYSRFQYQYEGIMSWEYQKIETFFIRMKGRFNDFYLVDWANPYRITVAAAPDYTLNSINGLTDDVGYIGNTLLLYNPRYDTQGGVPDKNILTIDSGGIAGTTITTTKDQSGRTHLDATNSYIYVLVPAIFDTDSLAPTTGDACIDSLVTYFPGYGNQYVFGPTYTINIPFLQLGVSQE